MSHTDSAGATARVAVGFARPARRWWRSVAIISVVIVPLAFAGLVIGALSNSTTAISRVPAAIVNSDKLIYQTALDGTKTPVFAGRQLVTELTGSSTSFDWTITNAADAQKLLKAGTVDAILTIPKEFSTSILSLQSADPTRADIAIRTDDSHSYLTGALAQTVGNGMVASFGSAITERYIAGLSTGLGSLGGSLSSAADGAAGIATGATDLGSGLGTLASGANSTASGANALSTGVTKYTGGVDSLSSGLHQLNTGAAGLSALSGGVNDFTAGVSSLATALAAANVDLQNKVPGAAARVNAISQQLSGAASGGATLAGQAATSISTLQGGISSSATGAAQLASGSAKLRSGVSTLAGGVAQLATGTTASAAGATSLASGATSLAEGLKTGAASVPSAAPERAKQTAKVAANPVGLTVVRDNKIEDLGKVLSIYFVPLGLWIGALAVFLVIRPFSRRDIATTASNGRLVLSTLGRASVVTGLQAALLVALLHLGLGVSWALLPATVSFAVLTSLAFTAFHYLLALAFGRAGLVVSLLLLALQITSTAGLYPVQLLATPFQILSPLLPLTYAVQGMQAIISGSGIAAAISAALVLLVFGGVSILLGILLIRRIRRTQALVLAAPAGSFVVASSPRSVTA